MSDEEKQAFDILDSFEPDDLIECAIYRNALEKINNLIEKQQKEIEIHKDNFEGLSADITQVLKDLGLSEETIIADEMVVEIKKKFVSKDKIREKMQEYYEKASPYDCDTADYKQSQEIGGWNALRKLLEE